MIMQLEHTNGFLSSTGCPLIELDATYFYIQLLHSFI